MKIESMQMKHVKFICDIMEETYEENPNLQAKAKIQKVKMNKI